MKHKLYKPFFTLLAICFLGTAFAQKFDKKFTENFKVNKNVAVAINATNTDINVTTWSKNEVQVEAFIEVEGISKEEAEKYFKNWNFEALGNSKTVKIKSRGNSANGKDFIFFNDMNFDFVMPDLDIQMPDLDAIVIPDMNFDFDFDFKSMEDIEDHMERKGRYYFEYHNDDEHIIIKTKEEWEKFKKSKMYEELKQSFSKSRHHIKNIDQKKLKESLEKAKLQMKQISKEEIRISLEKAREALKNINFNFGSNESNLTINGKKIKISKRLEIKVPKDATFDLNTRHCKVKLPNTKASGKVSYGSFDANDLNGGDLKIYYSPVNINDLNACSLFLNNVTDAKIASVTRTNLSFNSSETNIFNIDKDVIINDKFGKLTIQNLNPNYNTFNLNLDASEVSLNLSKLKDKLNFTATSFFSPKDGFNNTKVSVFNGNISAENSNKTIKITGKNSELTVIK